jgi:hypothetical protein
MISNDFYLQSFTMCKSQVRHSQQLLCLANSKLESLEGNDCSASIERLGGEAWLNQKVHSTSS